MTRPHVAVVLAVLLLAGCAPVAQSLPSPSPTPTVMPTPTPSPTPTPTGPPPLASLVATPDGLGPLLIGQQPPAGTDAPVVADPTCTMESGDPAWIAQYGAPGERPFKLLVDGTGVARIDITDPEIRTAAGVGVGSTHDEVLAAYPDGFDDVLVKDGLATVYGIASQRGWLMIQIYQREDGSQPFDVVNAVRIGSADRGIYSNVATDNVLWCG